MPDEMIAIFGDVHSNLEALQAVLVDMEAHRASQRVCLGDIVGYAANPAECLELVRSVASTVIQGNHDEAAAADTALDGMREVAQKGVEFARRKLSPEQRVYLASLPLTHSTEDCQYVHASLNAPDEWHYVMHAPEAHEHFEAQLKPLSFCGHTHVPTVWHLSNTGNIKAWHGEGRIELPYGGKILINVGSVGQPRDLCPDACYAIYDAGTRSVEFRRITYAITKTRRKITRAKLPPFAAQRLSLGC